MSAAPESHNPFPVARRAESEALVAVESSRAVAEIQAAMTIAKKFPRDQRDAMDRIINTCTRPALAQQALYTYARGGTDITGPSIRLAEALAQAWGNIKTSVRELEQRDGVSTVQAIAWDLESGYQSEKVFQVRHVRDTRGGSKNLTDGRDIYELVANQGARRLRACILAVIPGDVIEVAVKQCERTLNTKAEATPERIKALVEMFAEIGVTKEQIGVRIQRHVDAIQPAQIVQLGKIFNSIRDGMSTPAEWFEPIDGAAGTAPATGADRLKAAAAAATARQADAGAGGQGGAATAPFVAGSDAAGGGGGGSAASFTAPAGGAGPGFADEAIALLALDNCDTVEQANERVLDLCRGAPFEKAILEARDRRWPPAATGKGKGRDRG